MNKTEISICVNVFDFKICKYLSILALHKSPSEEKSIADRRNAFLYAIKEVLFDELKFTGNSKNYYDVENSFVRRVSSINLILLL